MNISINKPHTTGINLKEGFVHSPPLKQSKEFLSNLKKLSRLNSWKSTGAILFDWIIIVACMTAAHISSSVYVWIAAFLVITGRQHGLLILMHDGSHSRLYTSHHWNDHICNWFLAYPFFITTEGYRANHLAHHWYLNTDRDPDWMRKKGHKEWEFPMTKTRFVLILLKDIFGGGLIDQLKAIFNLSDDKEYEVLPVKRKFFQKTFYYVSIFTLVTLFDLWKPVLLLWFFPVFTLLPVALRLRAVGRHFGLKSESDLNMSRNYFPPFWERALIVPHNVGYHLDHHLYPSVPFYNLPKLHDLLTKNERYQNEAHQSGGLVTANGTTVLQDVSNPDLKTNLNAQHPNHTSYPPHIERIIEAAQRAPTGDNCQPFQYHWNEQELLITQDNERAKHFFNRQNHTSLISLGAVLESINMAAGHENLSPTYELKEGLCVILSFVKATKKKHDPLYDWLFRRTTDRRPYKKQPMDPTLLENLKNKTSGFPGTNFKFVQPIPDDLVNHVCQTDSVLFNSKAAHDDFYKWLRFSKKEKEQTKDGMSWQNLGINYFVSRLFKLGNQFDRQSFLNHMVMAKGYKAFTKKLLKNSTGVGCITTNSKDPHQLIHVGGLWLRLWCTLNSQGYGHQPLSSATLPLYANATGILESSDELTRGRMLIKKTFDLEDNEIPVILFRTGKSTPLPINMRTLRKPLGEIIK